MASVSLKRPSQDSPGGPSIDMFKKRCNRVSSLSSSPFVDPSILLTPVSNQIATTIKQEAISAYHTNNQQHTNHHHQHHNNIQQNQQQPLFTIAQTQIICEKIIKDREQKIREEYEKILHQKLAEQHEIYVKYTHDNITKIYNSSNISYLS